VLRIDEKNTSIELVFQIDVKIVEFSPAPSFHIQKSLLISVLEQMKLY